MVAAADIAEGRYGQPSQEIYDDLKDIDEIKEIIRSNPKRVVENNLLSQPARVRTALLVVSLIYGEGRGPLNRGHGFRLQAGHNAWSNIHIHDLSDQIVALTEAVINQRPAL